MKADLAVIAHKTLAHMIENTEKNQYAAQLGKLDGSKCGKNRVANLTPEQRLDITRKASQARWSKKA